MKAPSVRGIDLIVHQYLGKMRASMMAAHEAGEDYVTALPGFNVPATLPHGEIEPWVHALTDYMEDTLGLTPEQVEEFRRLASEEDAGEEWKS